MILIVHRPFLRKQSKGRLVDEKYNEQVRVMYLGEQTCLRQYLSETFQARSIVYGHENKWPCETHIYVDAPDIPPGSLCLMTRAYRARSVCSGKCQHLSVLENITWCLALQRVGASSYGGRLPFVGILSEPLNFSSFSSFSLHFLFI